MKKEVKKMDYSQFLRTPYWKVISEIVRRKADYKCILCSSSEKLNVHHRTYDNHGDELHNLEDLILLCGKCHEKFHDKDMQ